MWAAHEGCVKVARFLLEKGAFVDFEDIVSSYIIPYNTLLKCVCACREGGLHSCRPVDRVIWILSIYYWIRIKSHDLLTSIIKLL